MLPLRTMQMEARNPTFLREFHNPSEAPINQYPQHIRRAVGLKLVSTVTQRLGLSNAGLAFGHDFVSFCLNLMIFERQRTENECYCS